MRNTNSSGRTMLTVLLGLLLAVNTMACSGGPTEPHHADLIRMYSGRWGGNINGLEVVLNVQASNEDFGIRFRGTGTARSATGEIHLLRIDGGALPAGGLTPGFDIMVERGGETGPGSVILSTAGQFDGEVSPDGRTWPGRFTLAILGGAAPIFGLGEYSVTWIKE